MGDNDNLGGTDLAAATAVPSTELVEAHTASLIFERIYLNNLNLMLDLYLCVLLQIQIFMDQLGNNYNNLVNDSTSDCDGQF